MTKIWFYYPQILFINDNYLSFFPKNNMNINEKLNSIARFSIYYLILIIFFSKKIKLIAFPILLLLITIFIHYFGLNTNFENLSEIKNTNINNCRKPTKNNPFMNFTYGDHLELDKNPNKKNLIACNKIKLNKKEKQKLNNSIKNNFNTDIIKDKMNDYYIDSSMRNFYTLPNTGLINDQKGFALYLYKNGAPCKQDNKCI